MRPRPASSATTSDLYPPGARIGLSVWRAIASFLRRITRSTFKLAKSAVNSNKILHSLLYDVANIEQFETIGAHEKMLADSTRMDAYAAGISRAIQPGDVVVDLGCGTGILSMLAAKRNPKRIYAVDHSSIVELAERVAKYNSITCIDFVRTNSRTFFLDKKADVIIHEQMGAFLFDENMLENLMDLKRRVLKPDGIIVPAKFELYLEPVCLKREYRVPLMWENNIHGVDYSPLKDDELYRQLDSKRNIGNKVEMGKRTYYGSLEYYLCKPEPILTLDLNMLHSENDVAKSITCRKTIARRGAADGISIYFKTIFDDHTSFDTALESPKTSWAPPLFRIPRRVFDVDDVITLTLRMGNFCDVGSWTITLD